MPSATDPTVFPTRNDIAVTEFEGSKGTEAVLKGWMGILSKSNFVRNGFTTTDAGGLNAAVAAGTAFIDGFRVNVASSTTLALTASVTNHIFLNLSFDVDSLVDDVEYTVNTTGTFPASSLKIAEVTTDGAAVTGIAHKMQYAPVYMDFASTSGQTPNGGWQDITGTGLVVPGSYLTYPRMAIAICNINYDAPSAGGTDNFRLKFGSTTVGEVGFEVGTVASGEKGNEKTVTVFGMSLISAGGFDTTISAQTDGDFTGRAMLNVHMGIILP